jgi:hypothetical protein
VEDERDDKQDERRANLSQSQQHDGLGGSIEEDELARRAYGIAVQLRCTRSVGITIEQHKRQMMVTRAIRNKAAKQLDSPIGC